VNLEQHKQRGDMKVWLGQDEVKLLLENAGGTEQYIALGLGARCGLRSHEVLDVAPRHVHDTGKGLILRVHHGKGDKYRETPIPSDLATRIETVDDIRPQPSSKSILSVDSTRTLRRWVRRAAERCEEETGDEGWRHLSFHDLRATWATALRNKDVDAMVVCDWGGWNDLETFLDHYRGTSTPEAQRREREKVEWLV
jgi:integrase